jgi:alpha-beta hydrolase superfamily lysophospholipase
MQQGTASLGDKENHSPGLWAYEDSLVDTDDGWRLRVHRLRPLRPQSGVPVVCVPGHGTTAWTFFGTERGGIAGALAAAGRDVWLLDPRGAGESRHRRRRSPVRVQDKLWIDLPAFLRHVMRATGSREVDALGHSLGGVLVYLGALVGEAARFRRAVTLGSPLRIDRAALPPLLRTKMTGAVAGRLGRVPLSGLVSRIEERMEMSWMPAHFDPDHTDPARFQAFLRHGITDVYGPELSELVRWLRTGCPFEMVSRPRPEDGRRLPMPTRFIVGAEDRLTTPHAVRHAFDTIGSERCEYVVLGRAHGTERDYRHADILIGNHVHAEVAPLVLDWFDRELAAGLAPAQSRA